MSLQRAKKISKNYRILFSKNNFIGVNFNKSLDAFLQFYKTKKATVSDLNIVDYGKVVDYSLNFNYKKLSVVYLIIYHRYFNESKLLKLGLPMNNCRVNFLSTGFKFSRLDNCWKNFNMKRQKSRVNPIDLKLIL